MYRFEDARKYANKVFGSYSAEQILNFIYNDLWELSRDKIDVQRLNHKALIELALVKLKESNND